MRILRAMPRGMNGITFLLFVFAFSLVITISTPRTTYAEGPLLGTVRCLVETVLLQRCKPVSTPAPEPTSSSGGSSASPSSTNKSTQPSSPRATSGGAQATTTMPANPSSNVAQEVDIVLPKETAKMAPAVKGEMAPHVPGAGLTSADYMAFFNTYSRYATDVQPRQAGFVPFETSAEGWKILGMAWYWWVALGLFGTVIFTSVKSYSLRKASALPDM